MSLSDEERKDLIAIWAKTVDTQMHFNEMSVKSRQLGLTFVAAALGVGIVLLSRGNDFAFSINIRSFPLTLHVAVILVLGAWAALLAVRNLDLNVYHKMLRGAVTFGEDFEENYMKKIFDLKLGMTQTISHYSRYQDASKISKDGKYEYKGNSLISAEEKIREFYNRTSQFLLIGTIALFLFTNIEHWVAFFWN